MGMFASIKLVYVGIVSHEAGLGDEALFLKCGKDAVYGGYSVVSLGMALFYAIVDLNRAKGL